MIFREVFEVGVTVTRVGAFGGSLGTVTAGVLCLGVPKASEIPFQDRKSVV